MNFTRTLPKALIALFCVGRMILVGFVFVMDLPAWAGEWVSGKVQEGGGEVHGQASENSETLGKYPAGTPVRVYSELRNGFYSIKLQKKWKGFDYVWISESAVRINEKTNNALSNEVRSTISDTKVDSATKGNSSEKPFQLIPLVGVTFLDYSETNSKSTRAFTENLLSLQWKASYHLDSKWTILGDLHYTPFVISNALANSNLQIFSGRLSLGYHVFKSTTSFKISIYGGWFYSTTLATGFGYESVQGPQIAPVFTFGLTEKADLTVYFKYAPILKAKGSEWGCGAAIFFGSYGLSFDSSQLSLTFTDSTVIQSNVNTLGANYRF